MDFTINFWAIFACSVSAMVIAAIWYGPLFGKKWMEICGVDPLDVEARRKMQKEATPLYAIQFMLTLFQVWVLAYYIEGFKAASALGNSLWIWAAFIIPMIAGSAMWTNDPKKVVWARFLIQSGYQLVIFIMFGLILGAWK